MVSLLDLARHPAELGPIVQALLAARRAKRLPADPNLAFCYDMLNKVSRSFAIVIQQLPRELQDAVCIFYLALRALDTIEDDMSIPAQEKLPQLHSFHKDMQDRQWSTSCGSKWYKLLVEQYPKVSAAFSTLPPAYQQVIVEGCKGMGDGMAHFIQHDVVSIKDYDLYCFYVAGLVGHGSTKLFVASQREKGDLTEDLSTHMGLFLQKTNIIRDYLEDIMEEPAPRMFWPKEIWGQYGSSLDEFRSPRNKAQAVACLNHMIDDALRHAPYSLEYLSRLRDIEIFRFAAIPQIMAIGTLAVCYNNPRVFTGVVKLRRGQTALYMTSTKDMRSVYLAFAHFAGAIVQKADKAPKTAAMKAREAAAQLQAACAKGMGMYASELQRSCQSLHDSTFLHPQYLFMLVLAMGTILVAMLLQRLMGIETPVPLNLLY